VEWRSALSDRLVINRLILIFLQGFIGSMRFDGRFAGWLVLPGVAGLRRSREQQCSRARGDVGKISSAAIVIRLRQIIAVMQVK
jgi:hypothetical protein